MGHPKLMITLMAIVCSCAVYAQKDSSVTSLKDSLQHKVQRSANTVKDSVISRATGVVTSAKDKLNNHLNVVKNMRVDSLAKTFIPSVSIPKLKLAKSFITFNGGYIAYNLNYRTNIDTPLVEKNILQHSSTGILKFSVAGLPVQVTHLVRRSNSHFFRDINDVQVAFDAASFRNGFQNNFKEKLRDLGKQLNDPLTELDMQLKTADFLAKYKALNDPRLLQKLLESREVLNIPDLKGQEDSLEKKTIDTLKANAELFLKEYEELKKITDSAKVKKEMADAVFNKMKARVTAFQQLIHRDLSGFKNINELRDSLSNYGLGAVPLPPGYRFFMNVKKLAVGRNQVNHSELTSKNISLTGINFEYNSWYYVAIAAGTVDYRFRDFVVKGFNRTPQYMYLARLGIGKATGNHFIVSAYKGRKQMFIASGNNRGNGSIDITGFAAEARWSFLRNSYITAEVAQSLSPDFRKSPSTQQKFSISDNSNKALSIKLYSYWPQTGSRLEGTYKFAGANFQSFSSFQTNAQVKAWSAKLEQQLFNKKLKLRASLKTNEFTNPYIVQNYKANTVFKSIQATYRARNWPMITAGYVPVSQLTYVGDVLSESRFHSLNATMSHTYKFFQAKATSTFTYNRFYNNDTDSAFAYYNAKNFYFSQALEFKRLLMSWAVSRSTGTAYDLLVLNGYVNVKIGKLGSAGAGFKVNNFGKDVFETGPYGNLQLDLKKIGSLSLVFDRAFLPANNYRFVRNDMMNLNFTRQLP